MSSTHNSPSIVLDTGPSKRGWHRFGTAQVCMRRYALGLRPNAGEKSMSPPSPALVTGTMLHLALAHHYAHKAFRDGAKTVSAADRVLTLADLPNLLSPVDALTHYIIEDQTDLAAQAMPAVLASYTYYAQHYGSEPNYTITGIEHQLEARLPKLPVDRNLYTQRADLIFVDKQAMVWIADHKKVYAMAAKTADQYILHGQFLGYMKLGQHKFGNYFGGVILNRVQVDEKKPAVHRLPIPYSPYAVKDFVRNLVRTEQRIIATEQEIGPPETHGHLWPAVYHEEVCFGKYGRCPFTDVCRFGPR